MGASFGSRSRRCLLPSSRMVRTFRLRARVTYAFGTGTPFVSSKGRRGVGGRLYELSPSACVQASVCLQYRSHVQKAPVSMQLDVAPTQNDDVREQPIGIWEGMPAIDSKLITKACICTLSEAGFVVHF